MSESKNFFVRGYGRASTDHQALSTAQQESVVKSAFDLYHRIKPDWQLAEWGGFFKDEATARVSKFHERENGSLLIAASRPGDVIVVSNYDRIFANVVDVCDTLTLCRQRDIRLLVLDHDLDTTTIIGDFCFKVLALVKEMEVKEIRRRIREAFAHRKRQGLPTTNPPLGWRVVHVMHEGVKKTYFAPNISVRRKTMAIVELFEEWGVGYRKAYQRLKEQRRRNPSTGKPFNGYTQLFELIKRARQGFPLPNGSLVAVPIPADAEPIRMQTITVDREEYDDCEMD